MIDEEELSEDIRLMSLDELTAKARESIDCELPLWVVTLYLEALLELVE